MAKLKVDPSYYSYGLIVGTSSSIPEPGPLCSEDDNAPPCLTVLQMNSFRLGFIAVRFAVIADWAQLTDDTTLITPWPPTGPEHVKMDEPEALETPESTVTTPMVETPSQQPADNDALRNAMNHMTREEFKNYFSFSPNKWLHIPKWERTKIADDDKHDEISSVAKAILARSK